MTWFFLWVHLNYVGMQKAKEKKCKDNQGIIALKKETFENG